MLGIDVKRWTDQIYLYHHHYRVILMPLIIGQHPIYILHSGFQCVGKSISKKTSNIIRSYKSSRTVVAQP